MKLVILCALTLGQMAYGQAIMDGYSATTSGRSSPNRLGSGSPAGTNCTVGDTYFQTGAVAGQNLWLCTTTGTPGTWTQVSGTGTVTSVSGSSGVSCTGSSAVTCQADFGVLPGLNEPNTYTGTNNFLNSALTLNTGGLFTTNAKTSTYQVLASDFVQCKTIPVASGTFTITLVDTATQPATGQCINIINYGTGVVTLARSGQNINGAAANLTGTAGSATAPTGWHVVSDGTNYVASQWAGGSGGGASISAGAFSAIPSCTTTNYLYKITSGYIDAAICDGASGLTYVADSYAVTPPTPGSWTSVGSPTVTTTSGVINLLTAAGSNAVGKQATLTAPYSNKVMMIRLGSLNQLNTSCAFMAGWRASGSSEMLGLALKTTVANGFASAAVEHWNATGSVLNRPGLDGDGSTGVTPPRSVVWVRLSDNSTTKTLEVSTDGQIWQSVYSGTSSQFITPDQAFFGTVLNNNSSLSCSISLVSYN